MAEDKAVTMMDPEMAVSKAVVAADPDWYSKLPITGDQSGKWCAYAFEAQFTNNPRAAWRRHVHITTQLHAILLCLIE